MEKEADVIREIVREIATNPDPAALEEGILHHLGFDSMMTVRLIVEVEKRFDVVFEGSELEFHNLESIQTIADIVAKKLSVEELFTTT